MQTLDMSWPGPLPLDSWVHSHSSLRPGKLLGLDPGLLGSLRLAVRVALARRRLGLRPGLGILGRLVAGRSVVSRRRARRTCPAGRTGRRTTCRRRVVAAAGEQRQAGDGGQQRTGAAVHHFSSSTGISSASVSAAAVRPTCQGRAPLPVSASVTVSTETGAGGSQARRRTAVGGDQVLLRQVVLARQSDDRPRGTGQPLGRRPGSCRPTTAAAAGRRAAGRASGAPCRQLERRR